MSNDKEAAQGLGIAFAGDRARDRKAAADKTGSFTVSLERQHYYVKDGYGCIGEGCDDNTLICQDLAEVQRVLDRWSRIARENDEYLEFTQGLSVIKGVELKVFDTLRVEEK